MQRDPSHSTPQLGQRTTRHGQRIVIRQAAERDAEVIARLAGELGYPTDPKVIRAGVESIRDSPTDLLLVAVDSADEPVGWIQAHSAHFLVATFRVEIVGLVIAPKARRTGIGRALITKAEQWGNSIGAEEIVVRSNTQRVGSHDFYPAMGYRRTKTQHVYGKSLSAKSRSSVGF